MGRLLIIAITLSLAGCGDNFDRDELINGPQAVDEGTDTDVLAME